MSTPSTGAISTPDKWPAWYEVPRNFFDGVFTYSAHSEHFQGLVTILVGPTKKPYTIHKDLLCFYSDYFRAAFQGSFKEATERKIELAGITTDIFEHFQVWLYTRRLDTLGGHFPTIVKLWVFGDQHQIPLLQNCVIDALFEMRIKENNFDSSAVPLVYDNTLPGSPLRKAIAEMGTSLALQEGPKSHLNTQDWSAESLIDLVRAVERRPKDLKQYALPKRDKCFFHVHGKDEHC
jgi:hypothetical protein